MADFEILLHRNDMLVRVTVKNKKTGQGIETASTAEITLYDTHGKQVGGVTWPKSLTHQADGVWEATIPFNTSHLETGGTVKPGDELVLEATIDGGTGLYFNQRKQVRVKERN